MVTLKPLERAELSRKGMTPPDNSQGFRLTGPDGYALIAIGQSGRLPVFTLRP
jgi:hypothetical protein